ncbi:MAG: hypothetical protein LBV73_08510 [Paraburkholderia sp.]|jgi:surface antigen|nr:hypothetical protein [Paraburkholderia sp.]
MLKSPRILSGLAVALLLSAGSAAQAANLGFLNDTPATWMKQPDIDSLGRAVRDAMANKQDGETANWSNEGLRNPVNITATITPSKTEKAGDKTCRDSDVVVSAKGQTMTLRPQYCRTGSGAWVYQKKH